MKVILAVLTLWMGMATAANLTIADLSPCALQCVLQTAPEVGCSALDITCQCQNKDLPELTTSCLLSNCTLDETLQLSQFSSEQCNYPHDSQNVLAKVIAYVATTVIFLVIILRVISRFWAAKSFWWDDWFHIAAGVVAVPMAVFTCQMAANGFGHHVWDMERRNVPYMALWTYLCTALWGTQILLVKLSILSLYLRVFPDKKFRIIVFVSMGAISLSTVVLVSLSIFRCQVIRAAWVLDAHSSKCLDIASVALANAVINIATEVVIFVLPIPHIRSLQLRLSKKIGVYALFGGGVLTIAVAAARLPGLKTIGEYHDSTYDNVPAYFWTCLESATAHTVAAAPAIRSLFTQVKTTVSTQASKLSASKNTTGSHERPFHLLSKNSGILSTTTIRVTRDAQERNEPDIEMRPLYAASANVDRP